MAHVRTQIRDGFKALMVGVDGVATVSSRRSRNFATTDLPAIVVNADSEKISPATKGGLLTRVLPINVDVYVVGGDGSEDILDGLCAQIEALVEGAEGAPFDSLISHFPDGMNFAVADNPDAVVGLHGMRTTIVCRYHSVNSETISGA